MVTIEIEKGSVETARRLGDFGTAALLAVLPVKERPAKVLTLFRQMTDSVRASSVADASEVITRMRTLDTSLSRMCSIAFAACSEIDPAEVGEKDLQDDTLILMLQADVARSLFGILPTADTPELTHLNRDLKLQMVMSLKTTYETVFKKIAAAWIYLPAEAESHAFRSYSVLVTNARRYMHSQHETMIREILIKAEEIIPLARLGRTIQALATTPELAHLVRHQESDLIRAIAKRVDHKQILRLAKVVAKFK